MKLYELTKQYIENITKLNKIEDKLTIEIEKIREELYKDENEHDLSLSSFRYGRLIFLYDSWSQWKQIVCMGFLPVIFALLMKDNSIQGTICLIVGLVFSIGVIICGLRGRSVRNRIKKNFEKLGLDLNVLK